MPFMRRRTDFDMLQGSGIWSEGHNDEILTIQLSGTHTAATVSTVCPHYGGPLHLESATETFYCPWHGWKFDAQTGQCINRKTNVRLRFHDV